MCDSWYDSFHNFLSDMGCRPSKRHSIDRIDNDRGYYKENCRWATQKEQCRNTRKNVMVEYMGETLCISEWAERLNMNADTLSRRIRVEKMSAKDAFFTPLNAKRNNKHQRPVFVFKDGVFFERYDSSTLCAIALKISREWVDRCIRKGTTTNDGYFLTKLNTQAPTKPV